jgi:23S rRNA (cytidine1920-2'-O)/16S rRNA (cytidine1409-2'-O)-methyltransferase
MAAAGRTRLDRLLVDRGLLPSREKAQRAIEEGAVAVDGRIVRKPSEPVPPHAELRLVKETGRFVSRGGAKLERALELFRIDLADRVVLDAGASTGGFTHCALLHGARLVHAVDVGHGQLDPRLAADSRVRSREGTDIRSVRRGDFDPPPDVVVADLSFIPLAAALPSLVALLPSDGTLCCLVKPQFEAGRAAVGKGGIVRGADDHLRAVETVIDAMSRARCVCTGLAPSPVRGGDGNAEYLASGLARPDLSPGQCAVLSQEVRRTAASAVRAALDCPRP